MENKNNKSAKLYRIASTKTRARKHRDWCFTWNNYHLYEHPRYTAQGIPQEEHAIKRIEDRSKELGFNYVFQLEGYGVSGLETPHLQGYIECKEECTFTSLGFEAAIHYGRRKAPDRNIAIAYCTEIEKRKWHTTPYCSDGFEKYLPEDTKIFLPDEFHPWQKKAFEIIKSKPCRRTVHWFWDVGGHTGKTEFIRFLCSYYDAVDIEGRGEAIRHTVAKYVKETGLKPKIVVSILGKSKDEPLSYEGIERVKDGFFTSSKYRGFKVNMNPPHILIFANERPDIDALSADRWKIWEIDTSTLDIYLPEGEYEREDIPEDGSKNWFRDYFDNFTNDDKPNNLT